jgi:hypothetical protein
VAPARARAPRRARLLLGLAVAGGLLEERRACAWCANLRSATGARFAGLVTARTAGRAPRRRGFRAARARWAVPRGLGSAGRSAILAPVLFAAVAVGGVIVALGAHTP